MDDFDKEIKKIITKEVKLSEDYKSSVRNTINNCIQNSKRNLNTNKHTVEHNFISIIKKIVTAILIGASTITVYAATTRNFDFSKLGLNKLNENYNDSIVEMDQSIENEYVKITLSSMAADESYIIAEFRLNIKDKAINEFGEVKYNEATGYDIGFLNDVFINSEKITNRTSNTTKISDREFVYTQIINIMNFNEENLNIKMNARNFYINNSNALKIGKIIELKMNLKEKQENDFVIQEQKINDNERIIITGVGNTKFETYITAQKITENITYKDFESRDKYKYNSFIVTNENDEEILYSITNSEIAGKYLYVKNDKGEMKLSNSSLAKDNDIIKYVENFVILVGNQQNIDKVKITPIETSMFNERTKEESNEYKKLKWYPLVEGDNTYSAKSSLGGTLTINKIEINENDVTFYYETEGLQGNESKVILRKKIKEMNYIYPTRVEKAGINSKENKIVFLKDITMSAGLNTWKLQDMFDDINNVEFALMWGNRSKTIADAFTVNIPKQNNNIADFDVLDVYDAKFITLECGFDEYEINKFEICYDDKDNKVLSYHQNLSYIVKINPGGCDDINTFIKAVEKYYTDRNGTCNIIK